MYLNIDAGISVPVEAEGWDINPFFGGYAAGNSPSFQPVRTGTDSMDAWAAIMAGEIIDASSVYAFGGGGSSDHMSTVGGDFVPGASQYLGFRFLPDGGSTWLYGWMQVTFTVNQPGGLIQSWAWENSGAGIQAGVVPEPGAWLLSIIAAALAGCRRKRAS